MAELTGKVALITGGSTGIGLATAECFAREGAAVVIADVNDQAGEAALDKLRALGAEARYVHTDVSKPEDCERMVAETVAAFGRLDFAFNNAGISGGDQPQPTADYGLDLWHKVININLSGVYYCLRAQIPAMLKNGGGAIVNTSSVAGQIAFPGTAGYTAAKHGVVGLTKVVAAEYSAHGIRCNAIGPGFIETPMTQNVFASEQAQQWIQAICPAARTGQPEEIANVVYWLCHPGSSYLSGAYLPVDGGLLAKR
ncbi:SDR family oxidoreductase [Neisseriaceae bacterium JH1-16]|nr:SDR family oxidoreductase [Neisseriaceae bacterium JH1-16]